MRHIYIVDDDADVRQSLQLLLATLTDAHIDAFDSGTEFAARAGSLDPGVVLLDYYMPGLNGLAVLEHIVGQRLPFSVVMITAHEDVNVAVDALAAGACDFLEKPYEYENLLMVLRIAFANLDRMMADRPQG